MAEKETDWPIWLLVGGLIFAGAMWADSSDTKPPPASMAINAPVSAMDAIDDPKPIPKPVIPTYNYDTEEKGIYYYVSEASEDQRAKGITTGNVVAFRYHGRDSDGHHVLEHIYGNGAYSSMSTCSVPCKLIKDDDGRRTAYRTSSIIGAAFQDAMNGHLKIHRTKRRTPPPEPTWEDDPIVAPSSVEPAAVEPVDVEPVIPAKIEAD